MSKKKHISTTCHRDDLPRMLHVFEQLGYQHFELSLEADSLCTISSGKQESEKRISLRRPDTAKIEDAPDILNVGDLAKILGCTTTTVYNLMSRPGQNPPPHFKVGRCLKFRREAIERWMKERETK